MKNTLETTAGEAGMTRGGYQPLPVCTPDELAESYERLRPELLAFVEQEQLGTTMLDNIETIYLPLAKQLAQWHAERPITIGINGAQGSGKSTLGKLLSLLLEAGYGKTVLVLSIDDFYLSRQRRRQLAGDVHPLLATRGVPGTHDVELAMAILANLASATPSLPQTVPVFDKAQDELLPEQQWHSVTRPVDIILFEGWCVGAQPQAEQQLGEALNKLEVDEDSAGDWRRFVNNQLAGPYRELFGLLDYLVMLKVPAMKFVYEWRALQESRLAASRAASGQVASEVMNSQQVARFIMFFERVTRATLGEMPGRADVFLELNADHQVGFAGVKA